MSALISTDELAGLLGSPDVVVLNGSWHMPSEKRDALKKHTEAHIPSARFFDIDAISDTNSPYPHMLPSKEIFEAAVSALGISNTSIIVVYDSEGLFSAARVWWMFRVFGHDNIKVLDGGLPKWIAEKKPLESGTITPKFTLFNAKFQPALVRSFDDMQRNTKTLRECVVDARSVGRFNGTEPEPRASLRSGRIEGSVNIPFRECTDAPFHTLKSQEELQKIFLTKAIDANSKVIATCGSGVTACVLALALYELGNTQVAVYDGAWAQWATRVQG